jgi:hypothetical protein
MYYTCVKGRPIFNPHIHLRMMIPGMKRKATCRNVAKGKDPAQHHVYGGKSGVRHSFWRSSLNYHRLTAAMLETLHVSKSIWRYEDYELSSHLTQGSLVTWQLQIMPSQFGRCNCQHFKVSLWYVDETIPKIFLYRQVDKTGRVFQPRGEDPGWLAVIVLGSDACGGNDWQMLQRTIVWQVAGDGLDHTRFNFQTSTNIISYSLLFTH